MRQSRLDRQLLVGTADALDNLPACPGRRKDPVCATGYAEVGRAQRGKAGKVIEAIHAEPSTAHVPLHPFRDDLCRFVFVPEPQRARRDPAQHPRYCHRRRGQGTPYGPETTRARSSQRHDSTNRRRRRDPCEPTQPRGAAGGVSQPGEWRPIRLFTHARDERRSVVEHPVLERPRTAPWFTRALAMMPQVGEPHVEPRGAEKMRHPGVQPEAMVGKGAMDEENSRAAIAIGAMPAAASPAPICMRHPGLPVATTWGAASRKRSSLVFRTARDISGSSSVKSPALPQHSAAPGTGTSSSSGMAANSLRGCTATPWAWSRWHGGSYATCKSSGAPATGPFTPLPASSSVTSRTRAANLTPRPPLRSGEGERSSGSSASSRPYSFIRAPQPALFTTIGSSPSPNASTLTRAKARASSTSPACSCRAPQQTWPLT